MREHDETIPSEDEPEGTLHETSGEGVALSPYDSDLATPSAEAEPEPYRLDDSPGYAAAEQVPAAEPTVAAEPVVAAEPAAPGPEDATPAAAQPGARAGDTTAWPAAPSDDVAAAWTAQSAGPAGTAAGAAAVGAAGAGAAATAAATRTDLSDTAVRRSSLMQTQPPSNEPRRLMADTEADSRAERYAPESDADLFAGAAYDKVPSRAGAHWWSLLATLILTPIAWYLLSDAGARMTLPADNQWDSGVLNLAALGELLAGIIVLGALLISARASSLGAFVVGSLVALVGGAFVLFPTVTQDFLEPYLENLRGYNDFGANIAHHLVADGSTGRILVAGLALVMVGFVSHSARRRGRKEQQIREAIERRKATGF